MELGGSGQNGSNGSGAAENGAREEVHLDGRRELVVLDL
jgi:hypothetical protein